MRCGVEAGKLNLSKEEHELLEKEIYEGVKNNNKIKSLVDEHKIAQEQVNGLRLEKRERSLADKGTIDGYTDAIKSSKDKLDKEELQQLKEDNKQRRVERAETIKDYNNSIKALMDAKRTLVAQKKGLSDFIKQTQSNLVSKYIRGNANGVRKDLTLKQFASGKLTAKEIFDPIYTGPNSLGAVTHSMKSRVGKGTSSMIDEANINPNDNTSEAYKTLHDHVINNINDIARSLGLTEKHGVQNDQQPFSLSPDLTRSKLFDRSGVTTNIREGLGKKPILSEDGLEEYKNDWINSIGEEEIEEAILKAYPKDKYDVQPTIDEAFKQMRDDLVIGSKPALNFSNPKFLNDEAYAYMVNKYSGKSMLGNLVTFANRKINILSLSHVTGGKLTMEELRFDKKAGDMKLKYYEAIQNEHFGDEIGLSSTRYARGKFLNSYGKLTVATRPITMYISPMADRPIGAVLNSVERESFNIVSTIPLELFRGFKDVFKSSKDMFGSEDTKAIVNDAHEVFKTFSHAEQDRYNIDATSLSDDNLYDKSVNKLAGATINHFHKADNALQVASNRDFSMQVAKYKSFDDIPGKYKNILENKHHITAEDWKEIRKVGKDSEFITCDKFDGMLQQKIASIEVTSNLRGMPNEYPLLPGLASSIKEKSPIGDVLLKAFTQFWGFAIRTSVYGFKDAHATGGTMGVAEYGARLMARGFIPNMIVTGMITLARTGSFDETYDKMTSLEGVGDAMLGTVSRPLMALLAITNPNRIAYSVSTPIIRDLWNVTHSIKSGTQAVVNGDERQAMSIGLSNLLQQYAPGWTQTPFNKEIKDYIKQN